MAASGSATRWKHGGTGWTDDYPKGDRALIQMLQRFTRTHMRSVEQPVDLEDGDDAFYWPFLIAGLAGSMELTDEQAAQLREHLSYAAAFCSATAFSATATTRRSSESMKRVFPDRPIFDVSDDHPIFHVIRRLPEMTKVAIPHVSEAFGYGRMAAVRLAGKASRTTMAGSCVLIAYNNDVQDAWQWADDPRYPHELINLALRLGVNVAMYSMTALSSQASASLALQNSMACVPSTGFTQCSSKPAASARADRSDTAPTRESRRGVASRLPTKLRPHVSGHCRSRSCRACRYRRTAIRGRERSTSVQRR